MAALRMDWYSLISIHKSVLIHKLKIWKSELDLTNVTGTSYH